MSEGGNIKTLQEIVEVTRLRAVRDDALQAYLDAERNYEEARRTYIDAMRAYEEALGAVE